MQGVYQRKTRPISQFYDKIVKTSCGCWIWTGDIALNGYARYSVNNRRVLAHRLSYEIHKGTIPDGLEIDHLCRNRSCVNPDHLEAVTSAENTRRGNCKEASQKAKAAITHCPHGHPYSEANTYHRGNARHCRTCIYNSTYQRFYGVDAPNHLLVKFGTAE